MGDELEAAPGALSCVSGGAAGATEHPRGSRAVGSTEYRMRAAARFTLKRIKRGVNKRLIGLRRDDGTAVEPLSLHALAMLTFDPAEANAAAAAGVDLRGLLNQELQAHGLSGTRDPRFRVMLTTVLAAMPENASRLT